jgi:hypothetical protein
MKKILTMMIVALLCLSVFSILTPKTKAEETIIFTDDFESYNVGTFPSPPWQMWFGGMGTGEQRIVDTTYVSPTKSLRLWGANGWGVVAAKSLALTTDMIGYEVLVSTENWGLQYEIKTGAIVCFAYKISGSLWTYWATVLFNSDGNIRAHVEGSPILQSYNLNTWYKIRTVFSISSRMYSVWINDEFKGTFLEGNVYDPSLIEAFGLASDHAQQICYFDDVKVFEVSLPEVIPATTDIDPDTLNLQSKGKWITAYIELPEGSDVSDINVSTVMLNDTVPAELCPTAVGDYDGDGIPDLKVKFNRAEVISYILDNVDITERFTTITLAITGKLNDGILFQGSGTIRIIFPMHYWRIIYLEKLGIL